MDKYKVGNFITSLRKEKSISQGQLGLLLGVTNKAISKWENGNNQPEVEMLYRLSEVLGVSVDELVHGERENKSRKQRRKRRTSSSTGESNRQKEPRLRKIGSISLLSFTFFP